MTPMRLAILSDIHANAAALRAVLDTARRQGAERILCLGDIVGYNAEPAACIALLRQADAVCVAGNHDRAVTGQITTRGFSPIAARAVEWTRRTLDAESKALLAALPVKRVAADQVAMVHGALHPDAGCELVRLDTAERRALSFDALAAHPSGVRMAAFGHTHRAGVFQRSRDGTLSEGNGGRVPLDGESLCLLNPGSVGEPRGSDARASFMILDTGARAATIHRVAYDRDATQDLTRRAGLGPRLSGLPPGVRAALVWGVTALGLTDVVRRCLYARPAQRPFEKSWR